MSITVKKTLLLAILSSALVSCGSPDDSGQADSELEGANGSSGCSTTVAWRTDTMPILNDGVYNFAASNLNKTVGGGECSHLAEEALKKVGAKNFYQLGPTGFDADYVWGSKVGTYVNSSSRATTLIAGDILQFRNVNLSKTFPNGSFFSYSYPHHTAVVKAVSKDGSQICVYEQNSNNRRYVTMGTIDLTAMKSGTIWSYRPIK